MDMVYKWSRWIQLTKHVRHDVTFNCRRLNPSFIVTSLCNLVLNEQVNTNICKFLFGTTLCALQKRSSAFFSVKRTRWYQINITFELILGILEKKGFKIGLYEDKEGNSRVFSTGSNWTWFKIKMRSSCSCHSCFKIYTKICY